MLPDKPKFFGRRKGRTIRKAKSFLLENFLPHIRVTADKKLNLDNCFTEPKEVNSFYFDINFDDVTKKELEQKVYDINEVLKSAKEKRDIIEEASEKRKNSKYESHLDIEEELSKTRKVYDKILQEETELLDIMNTLANVQAEGSTNSYKDITSDSIKQKTATVQKVELPEDKIEKIDDDGKETTEYSTNTFMFSKKDFDSEGLEEEIKESNGFIKLLIALLIIAIILGAYYIVTTYILK